MKLITSNRQLLWLAVFIDLVIAFSVCFTFVLRQPVSPILYIAVILQVFSTIQTWRKRNKPYPGEPPIFTSRQKILIRIAVACGVVYVGYIFVTLYKAFATIL